MTNFNNDAQLAEFFCSIVNRAVVWTDTVQFVLMIGAVFAVIILGIIKNKYPMDIFSIADDGGRMILFE